MNRLRRANIKDIDGILHLLNFYKAEDLLLPRSRDELLQVIRDFWVVIREHQVIGCVALHPYTEKMAEIRSLAVLPEFQKYGLGKRLIQKCIKEGRRLHLETVIVLTYLESWFQKMGFKTVKKEQLPEKIWLDCQFCAKKDSCKEIALSYAL